MRFEEPDQGDQPRRLARPRAQLVSPDSGQVEEALCPPLLAERFCKRRKRER